MLKNKLWETQVSTGKTGFGAVTEERKFPRGEWAACETTLMEIFTGRRGEGRN